MAEVENLLGLITDTETRTKLIAQMEQMFDAAEDEGKLIEQIGSPTKVAVALIRYADKKRAGESPKAEAVPVPEAPVTELISEAEEIGSCAFMHIIEVLHAGMTERDVALKKPSA